MIKAIVCIALLNAGLVAAHPIKITSGKLEYFPAKGTLELAINFFIDDFEAQLQKQYGMPNLKLSNDKALTLKLVEDYTLKKFSVKVNKQACSFKVIQVNTLEDNVLQVKYVAPLVLNARIGTMEISDQFLFEAYKDQVNILHVIIPGHNEKILLKFLPFEPYQKITF